MAGRSARSRSLLDRLNVGAVPGMHLSAAEFDSLIVQHGSSGELRRCLNCPCIRIDTRTPDADCKHCKGLGWLYPEQLREPLIFLDTSRTSTWKLASAGLLLDGTAQVTFPSGIVPGHGDMILPDGEEHVVLETLYRAGSLRVRDENLREFRIGADFVKPALNTRRERLLYPTACCIEHVAYLTGSPPRLAVAQASEYHVDTDGRWDWHGDAGPAPGDAWSVRYRAPAVYVVFTSAPRFRTEADQPMPQLVTVKRLDKVSHEDLRV